MNRKLPAFMLAVASAFCVPATAETIYRCGDSYSQKPCEGAKVLQADDARTSAQGSQTSAAAQRDAKVADAMEKARLKEEAKPAQVYIGQPKAVVATKEDKKPVMAKPKKPQFFSAVSPGEPKKKKKKETT